MGRSTADLASAADVVSVVGNRQIAAGVLETVIISIEQLTALLSPAAVRAVFATKSEMDGALGYPEHAGAEVHGDIPSANGIYRKVGAAGTGYWQRVSSLTSAELAARIERVQSALDSAVTQLNSRITDLNPLFAALDAAVSRKLDLPEFVADASRPGESPRLYSSEVDVVSPLGSNPVRSSRGWVVEMATGIIAQAVSATLDPYREYRARIVMTAVSDAPAPAVRTIRLAVRWYDGFGRPLRLDVLEDVTGWGIADGRTEWSWIISLTSGDNVDLVGPSGAVNAKLYAEFFGPGSTEVELIDWTDLSNAALWSPDVSGLRNALAAMDERQSAAGERISDLARRVITSEARAAQAAYQEIDADEDFTASFGSVAKVIRHTATLTQPRSAILAPRDVLAGQPQRITRTGGGVYPLNVRSKGITLKSMVSNTWAEFVFDGTDWFLSASGSL